MNRKKMNSVICYMDKVDFDEELGNALDGNKVFPSIEDLKEAKPCTRQCGIVEVEVILKRVIQETDFSETIRKIRKKQPKGAIRTRHPHKGD